MGGNLDFPKIKKLKEHLFWCQNLHKNVKTFLSNFQAKLCSKTFDCFSSCFGLRGNVDFPDFHQKSFITSTTGLITWGLRKLLILQYCPFICCKFCYAWNWAPKVYEKRSQDGPYFKKQNSNFNKKIEITADTIVYKGTPKSATDVIVKARGSITKNCFTVLAQLCSARPSKISSGWNTFNAK